MLKVLSFLCCVGVSLTFSIPSSRNIDVEGSTIEKRPYQAAVFHEITNNYLFLRCGASIISTKHLLSNHYCKLGSDEMNGLYARLGSTNWKEGGQLIPVKAIIGYSESEFDAAIVVLNQKITLGPNVQIIKMAPQDAEDLAVEEIVNFSGWGFKSSPEYEPTLLELNISIGYEEKCRQFLQTINMTLEYCAAENDEDDIRFCSGHSSMLGSPMVYNSTLYGVTSGMWYCDNKLFIGTSYKIPVMREWIDETVKNNP